MDITQLLTFLTVADTGSFSAAGEQLRSVQSNVTARIRKLEASVGGPLFERSKAGARLTPLGERLAYHAREIVARVEQAKADLGDIVGKGAPLRLGAVDTTAGHRLPDLLHGLYQALPAAEVTLTTAHSGELMRAVWGRGLDAAFVVGPVDPDRFHCVRAFTERMVEVRHADTDAADILLAFPDGCSYRAAARDWLAATGRSDVPVRDFGSMDAILGCIAAGMGFAVTPQSAVRHHSAAARLTLRPLTGRHGRSETVLIRRIDTRPTRTLDVLSELLAARGVDEDAMADDPPT